MPGIFFGNCLIKKKGMCTISVINITEEQVDICATGNDKKVTRRLNTEYRGETYSASNTT